VAIATVAQSVEFLVPGKIAIDGILSQQDTSSDVARRNRATELG
jgi:hypothetical protein